MAGGHLYLAPLIPGGAPICLLDRESARRRREPSDRFLAEASIHPLTNGVEYRFPGGTNWPRLITYVNEERECCPFLAFEAFEEEQGTRLIVFQPFE